MDLVRQHKCDLFSLSETAAKAIVQKQFAAKFNAKKCKVLWSPPVPPLTETVSGHVHARGKASGTAILTSLPCRPTRLPLTDDLAFSTRFVHGIVQVGDAHLQVVVLYCKPNRSASDVEFNSQLMQFAVDQTKLVPLPYVIMGDFNMPVHLFECWPLLQASGCQSLPLLYRLQHAEDMPPSCMESTNPDNAIISSQLASFVRRIRVLPTHFFAAHAPVTFDLELPCSSLYLARIRHPRSFVELSLPDDIFSQVDVAHCFTDVTTLEEWGHAVENCYDTVLRAGHGPLPSLPKAFRGRCKPLKIVKCPVVSPTKQACPGSYEPSTEGITIASRKKVTQVRRLESFHRRLLKWDGSQFDFRVYEQLLQEWNAIMRSHAFAEPFLHWISTFPDMDLPAFPLPSSAWVFEALQLTRHFTEAALTDDMRIQRAKRRYEQHLDGKAGHKRTFAQVRGPGPPPVHQVQETVRFDAVVATQHDLQHHDIFADPVVIAQLSPTFPISIGSVPAWIIDKTPHSVNVGTHTEIDLTSEDTAVLQTQVAISSPEVACKLNEFWQPIWTRDQLSLDLPSSSSLGFDQFFSHVPPAPDLQIALEDPDLWALAIRKLRPASARGTDSISAQELKLLPPTAIASLAKLLASSAAPFPASFMHGLVAPLSKAGSDLPSNDRTRPITILPQLYRLWSSVICIQATRHLPRTSDPP